MYTKLWGSPRPIAKKKTDLMSVHSGALVATFVYTVEPRSTDTRLIRTPRYYGQFRWSRRKPHTFSLKLTRLIRTPVNTDNGHFSVSRVTNSYTLSTPLYGHYLSVHCEFSLSRLFANLKTLDPGQIMTEFEELKKRNLNSVTSGV